MRMLRNFQCYHRENTSTVVLKTKRRRAIYAEASFDPVLIAESKGWVSALDTLPTTCAPSRCLRPSGEKR
eukprot:m.107612 g.107612  ORF g.107612 m.107612 type:complete len:70 (+) comp21164_c0_seq2:726-935(+)